MPEPWPSISGSSQEERMRPRLFRPSSGPQVHQMHVRELRYLSQTELKHTWKILNNQLLLHPRIRIWHHVGHLLLDLRMWKSWHNELNPFEIAKEVVRRKEEGTTKHGFLQSTTSPTSLVVCFNLRVASRNTTLKSRLLKKNFGRPTNTKWRKGCPSSSEICISPWATWKIAFHHSFKRPTITFCVKGRSASSRICISPHVLGVRRARSDERVVSRRDLPNLPCGKEKKKL